MKPLLLVLAVLGMAGCKAKKCDMPKVLFVEQENIKSGNRLTTDECGRPAVILFCENNERYEVFIHGKWALKSNLSCGEMIEIFSKGPDCGKACS